MSWPDLLMDDERNAAAGLLDPPRQVLCIPFGHANAAMRCRLADRFGIARAMDIVGGRSEIDLYAAQWIARRAGRLRRLVSCPIGVRRSPRRVPVDGAGSERAGRRWVRRSADG